MLSDLRQALRFLARTPGFTALIVVVLAVGIGVTTAIFSIVDGVLFKPLPFGDPSRLIALQGSRRGEPDDLSYLDLLDWRTQSRTIDHVAGYAEDAARRSPASATPKRSRSRRSPETSSQRSAFRRCAGAG